MIKASDVYLLLREGYRCHGIDDWIRSFLVGRFDEYMSAQVPLDQIYSNGWNVKNFKREMQDRGFSVQYYQ